MIRVLVVARSVVKPFIYGAICLMLSQIVAAQPATSVLPGVVEPQRDVPELRQRDEDEIITLPAPYRRDPASDTQQAVIAVESFAVVFDRAEDLDQESRNSLAVLLKTYLEENNSKLTFSGLEDAAQLATDYLRSAGYLLARAIVPPQEVEKSVVRLDVYVGVMADVYAAGNELYRDSILVRPFKKQKNRAVELDDVESTILRIRDLPGLEANASFAPGANVGGTDLTVNVSEEDLLSAWLRLDNHGVESTGRLRTSGGVALNNVTRHRDQLRLEMLQTFDDGDLNNVRATYEIVEPGLVHLFGVSYSYTDYSVEDGPSAIFDIEGDNEITDVYVRSQWKRTRSSNFATRLGLAKKRGELTINNTSLGVDRLAVATFSLIADAIDSRFRGIHAGALTYHRGLEDFWGSMDSQGDNSSLGRIPNGLGGSISQLPGEFDKVTFNYQRLQSLSLNHSLLFRSAGQYSNDILSSLEKISIGGPNSVRAFPVAEHIGDRGIFAGLGWVIDGAVFSDSTVYDEYTLGDIFSLTVFADYGWAKNRNAGGSVYRFEIDGYGVQTDFRFPDKETYIELIAARPFSGDASNGDKFQFWFNLGIEF